MLAGYHLTAIGIFGSFTREDFREDSDIDILIDYEQHIGIEFIDLAEELEKILDRKVTQLKIKSKKQIHNTVKKQLGYLKRNIKSVNRFLDSYDS